MSFRCRKRRFKDKHDAVYALHLILNEKDGRNKPSRAYKCELCKHWHLTSKAIDDDKDGNYKLTLDWSSLIKTA